jgi:hypothetical protein
VHHNTVQFTVRVCTCNVRTYMCVLARVCVYLRTYARMHVSPFKSVRVGYIMKQRAVWISLAVWLLMCRATHS